jgi:hypothetical protein
VTSTAHPHLLTISDIGLVEAQFLNLCRGFLPQPVRLLGPIDLFVLSQEKSEK